MSDLTPHPQSAARTVEAPCGTPGGTAKTAAGRADPWTIARVIGPAETAACWLVDIDERVHLLERAAGCLIEPRPGDRVVVFADAGSPRFITMVLSRATLGEATLSAGSGEALRIEAPRLALAAGHEITIEAPALAVDADRATLTVRTLGFGGDVLRAVARRIESVADDLHSVAGRAIRKATTQVTVVEGADVLRAGQVIHEAREVMTLDAEQVVVTAREDVRVDGERISMG